MKKHTKYNNREMSKKLMNETSGGCSWGPGNHQCRAENQDDCDCDTPKKDCRWGYHCPKKLRDPVKGMY